jgi:DNA-binding Lrp family transcriptional regulator
MKCGHMSERDKLDMKILFELQRDARQSFRDIARRCGASVATILSRVRKLEGEGVIKGYTAIVDPEKVGYDVVAVIELTVSSGKMLEVQREIAKDRNVVAIYDATGESDSIVIARFRGRKELSGFVKGLLRKAHIQRTNTHLVLNVVKEDFRIHI